jgi:stage III sporulation protein AG
MTEDKRKFVLSYQDLFKKFHNKPAFFWIVLGFLGLGVVLLLSGNDKSNSSDQNVRAINQQQEDVQNSSAVATQRQLELELTKTLTAIAGVGRVKVEINLKSSSRKVWERQLNISKRVTQEQGVVNTEETNNDQLVIAKGLDGRDAPILKEELAPEIQGVIVVASGANNTKIKEILINTVMTILNLPAHRVMVIAGTNEEGQTK